MFTDSAGTTPVGTPGNGSAQPVGLLLDKSQNAVGTNGAARYNLLTYSEQLDNAAWGYKNYVTVDANASTAPDGTTTADFVKETATTNYFAIAQQASYDMTTTNYTASICLKANGRDTASFGIQRTTGSYEFAYVKVDLTLGTITGQFVDAGATIVSSSITSLGSGWYRVTVTGRTGQNSYQQGPTCYIGTTSHVGDTTKGLLMWGADFRLASQAALTPTYQPITSSWAATMAGNHATQSTASARPALSALYNLLTYTEDFTNGAWGQQSCSVSANVTTAPDGTTTADKEIESASSAYHYITRTPSVENGVTYTLSVCVKAAERYKVSVFSYLFQNSEVAVNLNLSTGVVMNTPGGGGYVSHSVTSLGNGWYRVSLTGTCNATTSARNFGFTLIEDSQTTVTPYAGNGTSGIYVWGADLRVTNDGVGLPAYQRVGANTDTYDSVGFPYYLLGDGVNWKMATGNINMTVTNKVTTFMGLRRLADATDITTPYEFNYVDNAYSGSFCLFGRNYYASSAYDYSSRGSSTAEAYAPIASYPVPISNIVTGISDISAPVVTLRVNGSQIATSTASQGSGNYSNAPLTLFSRPYSPYRMFNGRNYGLIIRGAASTATEISNTETWLNGKTKAY